MIMVIGQPSKSHYNEEPFLRVVFFSRNLAEETITLLLMHFMIMTIVPFSPKFEPS